MRHFYLNRLISHFFLSVLELVIMFELRISKNKTSSEYFFGTWSLNYLGEGGVSFYVLDLLQFLEAIE